MTDLLHIAPQAEAAQADYNMPFLSYSAGGFTRAGTTAADRQYAHVKARYHMNCIEMKKSG